PEHGRQVSRKQFLPQALGGIAAQNKRGNRATSGKSQTYRTAGGIAAGRKKRRPRTGKSQTYRTASGSAASSRPGRPHKQQSRTPYTHSFGASNPIFSPGLKARNRIERSRLPASAFPLRKHGEAGRGAEPRPRHQSCV